MGSQRVHVGSLWPTLNKCMATKGLWLKASRQDTVFMILYVYLITVLAINFPPSQFKVETFQIHHDYTYQVSESRFALMNLRSNVYYKCVHINKETYLEKRCYKIQSRFHKIRTGKSSEFGIKENWSQISEYYYTLTNTSKKAKQFTSKVFQKVYIFEHFNRNSESKQQNWSQISEY